MLLSQVFKCQGALCYSGPRQDLSRYQFKQAPAVVPFSDAVILLAKGLHLWQKEACPGNIQTLIIYTFFIVLYF